MAFFKMFALNDTLMLTGMVPKTSVALAVARATQMGSVQPIAGTTQRRTSAVI
jgi:hypothetical protein